MEGRSDSRFRAAVIGVGFLYIVVEYLVIGLASEPADVLMVFQTFPPLVSSLGLYVAYRRCHSDFKAFWLLLSIGSVMYAGAQIIWNYYQWVEHRIAPIPSLADVFWNIQTLAFLCAFYWLIYRKKHMLYGIRFLFDMAIILIVILVLGWNYLLEPNLKLAMQTGSIYESMFLIGYPVSDLLILLALFIVHLSTNRIIPTKVLGWLTAGFLFMIVADVSWMILSFYGYYENGSWPDPFWSMGMICIGIGALFAADRKEEGNPLRLGRCYRAAMILIPYLSIVLLLIFMLIRTGVRDFDMLGSAAATILIAIRQITVIGENRRLLRQVQHNYEITEKLAKQDALTGLPNRRDFLSQAEFLLSRASRSKARSAVLFLDLDQFKYVNDTLGHQVGDELLRTVSDRLRDVVTAPSFAARIGGDEFIVFFSDYRGVEELDALGERIIQRISEPFRSDHYDLKITTSIGVARYPEDGLSIDELMKCSDMALYRAKELGRNRMQLYTPQLRDEAHRKVTMLQRLETALDKGQFEVFYQPLVRSADSQIAGFEALVRWFPESGRPVSPGEFIPLLEESRLIVPVGEWILREACRQAVEWRALPGGEDWKMNVNVSPVQLHGSSFLRTLRTVLQETGLPPEALVLEVTEGIDIGSISGSVDLLREIKSIGVNLAMDDFGTGYSSVSYLQSYHVHTLKIAQDFIRGMTGHGDQAIIVQGIIALAHGLRLEVVAEGVETQEQVRIIRELGCEYIQGYYFYKPMPAHEVTAVISREGSLR